ncbi:hypothetical protein AKO1_003441 [Acrasis kona]|uniref:Uncharacterized protein n=1 Tax=Acrasis kona TaxID=1008807 RepID=A0AAW2Z4A0_9EUKA
MQSPYFYVKEESLDELLIEGLTLELQKQKQTSTNQQRSSEVTDRRSSVYVTEHKQHEYTTSSITHTQQEHTQAFHDNQFVFSPTHITSEDGKRTEHSKQLLYLGKVKRNKNTEAKPEDDMSYKFKFK